MTLATWREQTDPQVNGQPGGAFAHGRVDARLRISRVDNDGALARAGANAGDLIVFAHKGTVLRQTFSLTEQVPATIYTGGGARQVLLQPTAKPSDGSRPVLSALLYLINDAIALALVVAIVLRRGDETAMLAFAVAMLANSPVTFVTLLPAGDLQDMAAMFVRPLDFFSGYIFFLLFALKFPHENALFRRRFVRYAFYIASAVLLVCTVLWRSATLGIVHVPPALYNPVLLTSLYGLIGCAILSLAVLARSWTVSTGAARNRVGWILLSIGTTYLAWIGINLSEVVGYAKYLGDTDFMINIISLLSFIGFGYALLRHRIFDFGFAVNRTLVFTMTSLLLFLIFWLIEQGVHKLVHFDDAGQNAMVGGAIAFGLFFAFNRVHHRVEHWIEHLFFRQCRARESALRQFVAKAAHFQEIEAMVAAFGAALDHFTGNAGNAIYLAGEGGQYVLAHSTLIHAQAILAVDDDVVVTLRARRHGTPTGFGRGSAFPMWQGDVLKGIVVLATGAEAEGLRPDQVATLEFACARICLELSSLQAKELARKYHQIERERERWQDERAVLQLVLSKLPAAG
jgi:hypothetical protein